MADGREVKCVMCQRSEETSVTGPMSTKDGLTAHQNCLLFASGLYCKNTPEFDDLFGFSVEDVRDEVNRGNKLTCRKCKKRGAAAGCEVRRCKKSYHYPCAVEDKAKITEDPKGGLYGLFCPEHYPQPQGGAKNDGAENGMDSDSAVAGTSNNVNGAGSSKKRLRIDDRHKIPLKRILSDSSSCSEEDQPNTDMNIFAPIESDFDESANSVPGQQVGFILFLINIIISRP
ncbi:PHD finger protein 6-like isoform X4 [Solea solea]|uniref:PHD finger protein 6-like isoform X4 n=1 Tax=Solea solea TaxID=90069 RepID=UPI00272B49BF|nr:PHD finger protein 6-like isoform X4 [Solea solea]